MTTSLLMWHLCLPFLFLDFCISATENWTELGQISLPSLRQHEKLVDRASLKLHLKLSSYSQDSESCLQDSNYCPLWSYCDSLSNTCTCLNVSGTRFKCDGLQQPQVLQCNCVSYHKGSIQVGYCIYNCVFNQRKNNSDNYYFLSSDIFNWTDNICGRFNRNGTLCGKCAGNFYPRAYSFDLSCMQCPNGRSNWWLYIMAAFLPLTVFYFTILLLHINVHSSHLQGFALYCQLMSTPIFARNLFLYIQNKPLLLIPVQLFGSLYGIWNLDFFRMFNPGICLQTDTLSTLALDLAVAIYPLLLMSVTYTLIHLYDRKFRLLVVLWKPFKDFFYLFKRSWNIRTSTVDAFATFMFLSNAKLLSVCFDLLIPVKIDKYEISGGTVMHSSHWRLYYDATIPYFGNEHVRYAYLAFLILLFFVFLPIFILTLYPFKVCQKCLNLLPRRLQISLHIFIDSFQGCYKDGTQPGSRDCRWFSALPFLIRLILFIIYACTLNPMGFPLSAVVLVLSAIAVIRFEPYKTELSHFSNQLVVFILSLSSFMVCITGGSSIMTLKTIRNVNFVLFSFFIVVLGVAPLLYISVLIFIWMIRHRKFGFEFIRRIKAKRLAYSLESTL